MRRVLFLSAMLMILATTVAQGGTPRFDGSIPIYPKSTLATAGGLAENDSQMAAKLKTGTEATFVTNDSVSTVATWYRKPTAQLCDEVFQRGPAVHLRRRQSGQRLCAPNYEVSH